MGDPHMPVPRVNFDFILPQFGALNFTGKFPAFGAPCERPALTRADIDSNSAARHLPLPTDDGFQIRNPFADRSLIHHDISWSDVRWHQFTQNFEKGYAKNIRRTLLLGRGGQHDVYATNTGLAIRAAGKIFYAERMLMLQGVLEYFGVPHLRLRDDETALDLALEFGATLQSRIPVGARSLDDLVRGWDDRWEDVLEKVEMDLGIKAREELVLVFDRTDAISHDVTLVSEAYRRGYAVVNSLWSDGSLENTTLIDKLGGGNWGANLYYHSDHGWFLVDW